MRPTDRFQQEALRFARERALLPEGTRVLAAVSGGLDSTVLADYLAGIRRLLGITVELAHVNHSTRGLASEREAAWVRVLAERLQVGFHGLTVSAGAGASQADLRDLRRQALTRLAEDVGADVIATAHHADDNAETFLMRAMSGTGSRGLSGIAPKEGPWIRPLLWATRQELEAFARERRLAWVEDPSNARLAYLRNRIRLEALPLIEGLRAGSVRNLARLAERLEQEETEIDAWLTEQMDGTEGLLSLGWLERWPRALQRRALGLWLKRLGLDYDPLLVEALLKGDELIHPSGSFLRRSDTLVFSPENDFGELWKTPIPVEMGRRISLGASMAWSFLPGAPQKLRRIEFSAYFVFRQPIPNGRSFLLRWSGLPWPLVIRQRRANGEERFDRWLREAGVPRPYWKLWPVVADAQNPDAAVALLGIGALEDFKPSTQVAGGRCLSVESFYEERLNAVSQS